MTPTVPHPSAILPPARMPLFAIAAALLVLGTQGCSGPPLQPWHEVNLTEEFAVSRADDVVTLEDYQQLEDRLFRQLDDKVYSKVDTGPAYDLFRYSSGSAADPRNDQPNWNRSFEMRVESPVGSVLLLHGMSDSPYSLHTLAQSLQQKGFWVLGMRLPGHGTAPSGLKHVAVDDMTAAVRLAMQHLAVSVGERPIHIVGYSNGATLALDFALEAMADHIRPVPASLVLISPSIQVHRAAALASVKDSLSVLPGLGGLAWLQITPEFDPYKYNSFATNAGDLVHRLTTSVRERVAARARDNPDMVLPPILVFKSTVDATVTTEAIVDGLLMHLLPHRHELVLFDINRSSAISKLLIDDPAPLTERLLRDEDLPFGLTLVTNEHQETSAVVARFKAPYASTVTAGELLGLSWPAGVISLSHVALPFPTNDPLYGGRPPENEDALFLGDMALLGERGLLVLPGDWLLRMRYNPFYDIIENRTFEWFDKHSTTARPATE